jgi:hypothetical protein
MNNACLQAAVAELEAVGIRDYQLARGGKHLQLRWSINGHPQRMLALPSTPSDWRSSRNTRRDVRALLRLDGVLDMPKPENINTRGPPNNWQRQLTALARMLNRVNVLDELVVERDEIVAALRRLADRTTEGGEP